MSHKLAPAIFFMFFSFKVLPDLSAEMSELSFSINVINNEIKDNHRLAIKMRQFILKQLLYIIVWIYICDIRHVFSLHKRKNTKTSDLYAYNILI